MANTIQIKQIDISGITLSKIHPDTSSTETKGRIIVLGNAYGIMPYQPKLASQLAIDGYETWWFPYRGQDGSKGTFSGFSGIDDLNTVLTYHRQMNNNLPLFVISHCTSGLIMAEFFRRFGASEIKKVIFYGFLLNISENRMKRLKRFASFDTRFSFSSEAWSYDPRPGLRNVNIPLLFCHGKDAINRQRATQSDIQQLASECNDSQVRLFKSGYDIDPNLISNFLPYYLDWFGDSSITGENKL